MVTRHDWLFTWNMVREGADIVHAQDDPLLYNNAPSKVKAKSPRNLNVVSHIKVTLHVVFIICVIEQVNKSFKIVALTNLIS